MINFDSFYVLQLRLRRNYFIKTDCTDQKSRNERGSYMHYLYRKANLALCFLDSQALPRLHAFSYEERRNSAPAFVSSCSNTRSGQHDKLTHHAVYRTSVAGCNSPANNSSGCNIHILQQRLIDGKGRVPYAFSCTLPQNLCKVCLDALLCMLRH